MSYFFNAPMKRNELMVLSQYCASPQFLSLGDWVKLPNGSILAVKGTKDVTPVHCTIVGQISGEKAYVGLKGNFNPNSTYEKDARGAKIQFTLTRPPPEVVDFVDDWDVALDALAKYQDTVAGSDEHLYFIDHDNLRFNFFLFEPKEEDAGHVGRRMIPRGLPEDCKPYWEDAMGTHNLRSMPVYSTDDMLVEPQQCNAKLPGALVEVVFTLRHHYIRPSKKSKTGETGHDVYSAHVEMVSILKNRPPIAASPYKSSPARRPRPVPQGGPTRSEQVAAANAFVPAPAVSITPNPTADPVLGPAFVPAPAPAPASVPATASAPVPALQVTESSSATLAPPSVTGENVPSTSPAMPAAHANPSPASTETLNSEAEENVTEPASKKRKLISQ